MGIRVCPHCKKTVDESLNTCIHCGKDLETVEKKETIEQSKSTSIIGKYIERYNLKHFDLSLGIIIVLGIVVIACFCYSLLEGIDGAINGGGIVLGDGEEYSYGLFGFLLDFGLYSIVTLYAWVPSLAIITCLMSARRKKHDLQK